MSSSQVAWRLLLPATAGVTAVLLYWLGRRTPHTDLDESNEDTVEASEDMVETCRDTVETCGDTVETVTELCVPQRAVGSLLGRRGACLRNIENVSGACVTFGELVAGDSEMGSLRRLVISGTPRAAQQARSLVEEVVCQVPELVTAKLDITVQCLGHLIGRAGSHLRHMSQASGANIMLDHRTATGPPTFTVTGTCQQVDCALGLLQQMTVYEADQQASQWSSQLTHPPGTQGSHTRPGLQEATGTHSPQTAGVTCVDDPPGRLAETDQLTSRQEQFPLHGGQVSVYVSAVEHPGHFWLQLLGEAALELEVLQGQLTTWAAGHAPVSVSEVTSGQLVVAQYEADEPTLYRGRVVALTEDGRVDIDFLDYGDNALVHPSLVYPLRCDFDFERLPYQAVECALAGVQPLDGTSASWGEAAILAFEELAYCGQWRSLSACRAVSAAVSDHGLVQVTLLDCSGEQGQAVDIGQELLRRGLVAAS